MTSTTPNWTYTEWVAWLEQRSPMPEHRGGTLRGPSLEAITKALNQSGLFNYIESQKTIHVAGTNGKGSTCKTLQCLLTDQKQNVGLFISPHLVDTCERISINGHNILKDDFMDLCRKHYVTICECNLSHFEALTLFAVDYFYVVKKVDWAIFEIGLGGTWDATNAIPHDTSIITTLGMDHQHILGNTIEEIAKNKFGIIQKNNFVFHYDYKSKPIQQILQQQIAHTQSQNVTVPPPQFQLADNGICQLQTPEGPVKLSLLGERAAENMWLALHVFNHLGFDRHRGLATLEHVHWPARLSLLTTTPCPIYLSGDHNIQGIQSLTKTLATFSYNQIYIILGLSKNRSHKEFLTELCQLPRHHILLTQPRFRGVSPSAEEDMYDYFSESTKALAAAKSRAQKGDLIVITGSLYLCGEILQTHF